MAYRQSSSDLREFVSEASPRSTSIVIAVLETGEVYIIISLSTRQDTQVVYIDPTTGVLIHNGKYGQDIFNSEEEAFNYITDRSRLICKSTTLANAIIGYSVLGSTGLLLVATKVGPTVPDLPGGGCVLTIIESQWIKIHLQNPQPQGKGEFKNVQELAELEIDGKYYFCETRDITRPFPSENIVKNPDGEFVWNEWFSKPFKDIGLDEHCVVLLQGFAECRNFGTGQNGGTVALIARRSKLHPGTRYLARGLNACSGTGNEVECEQIVWAPRHVGTNQPVPFNTYIWRRGTIPIWWGAEVKIAVEAEIFVSDDPYRGTAQYYTRLRNRYAAKDPALQFSKQGRSPVIPVVCVNLLRSGDGKSEKVLVEHFNESIKLIRSNKQISSDTFIQMINYDWHHKVKEIGEQSTIEGLWKLLKAPTKAIGFNEGVYFPSKDQLERSNKGLIISNDGIEGCFCMKSLQNGVIRFNCADSLDRTNAASFFGAVQVFVEQCTKLNLSLEKEPYFGFSSNTGSLPPGWEERFDQVTGKPFYIDHNRRKTTWIRPSQENKSDKSWKRFDFSFDQFKNLTNLNLVNYLADLFLLAGDIHATIYTGSKAMHSQILSVFNEESGGSGGRFSKLTAAQANVKIMVQRRYTNYMVDNLRQKQLEMLLGLRLFKHLPSMSVHPLKVLSRPTGCVLKPVPSIIPVPDGGSSLLSYKKKELVWVCPQAAEVVELFIFLAEPCHVCQLLLTVSHRGEEASYPASVDVRLGSNLDSLKLVLEGASIPQCENGTNLAIPLTGKVEPEDLAVTGKSTRLNPQEKYHLPLLYDFEEIEGELNFLSRIVALTFYPSDPGIPITLGEVEVLGVSLPWMHIFNNKKTNAEFLKLAKENPKFSQNKLPEVNNTLISSNPNPSFDDKGFSHNQSNSFDFLTGDFELPSQPSNDFSNTGGIIDNFYDSNEEINPFFATSSNVSTNKIKFDKEELEEADDFNPFATSGANKSREVVNEEIINPFSANSEASVDDKSDEEIEPCDNTKEYLSLFRSFSEGNRGRPLTFEQSMKLEIQRLRSNLSSAERDKTLLSISVDPTTIDPNRILDPASLTSLCNYADTLALLGHAFLEDRVNASLGLETGQNGSVVDFWNVDVRDDKCFGGECEVSFTGGSGKFSNGEVADSFFLECPQCERKTCKGCCAGKGAFLLLTNNFKDSKIYTGSSGGSSHGNQNPGFGYFALTDGVVCKECCREVVLQALFVDYVRVLASLRRKNRADTAAAKALNQVYGNEMIGWEESVEFGNRLLKKVLNGFESLAEFPHAGFLYSVETDEGSEPLLSLIAPLGIGERESYWRSPVNTTSVEFSLVLGRLSDVSGVAIIVSSCGYSSSNCPIVEIWASNKISNKERSFIGKWDVKSIIKSSSNELFGPDQNPKNSKTPRNIKFPFQNPIRCRIIWIKMTLPKSKSSSSNFEAEFNLLSFENSFAKLQSSPVPDEMERKNAFIHAKRIIIFGKSLRAEIGQDASAPELMRMKSLSSPSQPLDRFRIPAVEERMRNNDLIVEQLLAPTAPIIAGFRVDFFNVVKPRVTHSPSLDSDIWDSSLTRLEDRFISPPILSIQVFALQEGRNLISIGEYRLPEAKIGTKFYFDFSQPIQARLIIFRLLGDVTGFTDDISELDGSGLRNLPLASGLSLANKIKLYYYADRYEMGKIASFTDAV